MGKWANGVLPHGYGFALLWEIIDKKKIIKINKIKNFNFYK